MESKEIQIIFLNECLSIDDRWNVSDAFGSGTDNECTYGATVFHKVSVLVTKASKMKDAAINHPMLAATN